MSVSYRAIQWTPRKRVYDGVMLALIATYLGLFVLLTRLVAPSGRAPAAEVLMIRASGTCAIALLHVILWIGPLARLTPWALPLLSNRRHLGVTMFLMALLHATLSLFHEHGPGLAGPLVSLLTANTNYTSLRGFPFETLGLCALVILFLLAATSHDFWLKNLTPRIWKSLHMLVYAAYGLLVMHVCLGALQTARSPVYAWLIAAGAAITVSLHLATARKETRRDASEPAPATDDGFAEVGTVDEIENNRAKVVCFRGRERIAVFRYDGKISAVSNVCEHQGGPLGEGRVVDGCITCPWHGWQYRPGDGCAPPPFTEKIATYQVRLNGRRILVHPRALPRGTPVEPARIEDGPEP
jgi:nitrite reductase/ring-hydroxylating ferredoxin subunit/DMSO/TMAO reductase YedYZ heme-binding membrane subunit